MPTGDYTLTERARPHADRDTYTADEVEFMSAMNAYRKQCPCPDCRDVLKVAYSLGYRKVNDEPGRSA